MIALGWIMQVIAWIFLVLKGQGIWFLAIKDLQANQLSNNLAIEIILTLLVFIFLIRLGGWLKNKGKSKVQ